jgi:hypothetical protein
MKKKKIALLSRKRKKSANVLGGIASTRDIIGVGKC